MDFKKESNNRTYWKFNSSLLKDSNCVKEINETIKRVTEQYVLPVYNIEKLEEIPQNELQFTISDQLFLDVLMMEMRSTIIAYSVKKKKATSEREKKLEKEIQELENKIEKTERDFETITLKKTNLQEIRKEKIEGVITRKRFWNYHLEKD